MKYATVVVGSSSNSRLGIYSADNVDFYCNGTNDSTTIQQAVHAAGAGGIVVFLSGKYNINATIQISSAIELYGMGNSTIFTVQGLDKAINISSGGVKIHDISFQYSGDTPASGSNHIYIGTDALLNIEIYSCSFNGAQYCINSYRTKNLRIHNNFFNSSTVASINYLHSPYGKTGAIITNNQFNNVDGSAIIFSVPANSFGHAHSIISSNIIKTLGYGIKFTESNKVIISNNLFYATKNITQIYANGIRNSIINSNVFQVSPQGAGIPVILIEGDSYDNQISKNQLSAPSTSSSHASINLNGSKVKNNLVAYNVMNDTSAVKDNGASGTNTVIYNKY